MKIYWTSWHFQTSKHFLEYLMHQSPGRSGKWKELESTTNISEATHIVSFDGISETIPNSFTGEILIFGQHPRVDGSGYSVSQDYSPSFTNGMKKYGNSKDPRIHYYSLDKYINAFEWWGDFDYDQFTALKKPEKTKQLACIVTYQPKTNKMYEQRIKFLQSFVSKQSLDIYGRPEEGFNSDAILKPFYKGSLGINNPDGTIGNHKKGKNVLLDYKYSIEIDVGPTRNYLSERWSDALLFWCKPIYFGSNNAEEFFPRECFEYFNILDTSESNCLHVYNQMLTEEVNYTAMAEARDLILNKYNVFPYVYNKIKEL